MEFECLRTKLASYLRRILDSITNPILVFITTVVSATFCFPKTVIKAATFLLEIMAFYETFRWNGNIS
jgi:hypothetical protein